MALQPSPYTPGETAREVPGREEQLQEIGGLLTRVALQGRLAGRVRVDIGPRGVGKTSLLRRAQRMGEELGLATVFVTAGNGALAAVIADEVAAITRSWGAGDALSEWVDQVRVSAGVPGVAQVQITGGGGRAAPEATRAFREMVRDAAALALECDRTGLAVFVDELQSADRADLRTVAYAWQELQADDRVRAALLTAGLSHTPDVVTAAVTSGERFAFRPMRDLRAHEAREALTTPSTDLGVRWETRALEAAVERAQGYPYFVQLYGEETWRAAGSPDPGGVLDLDAVERAQARVDVDLTELYRTRWAKASAREREILQFMAGQEDDAVARRDIASHLGVDTTALSMARQSLLDKGILDAPAHGRLAFTVPGFGRYVRSLTGAGGGSG